MKKITEQKIILTSVSLLVLSGICYTLPVYGVSKSKTPTSPPAPPQIILTWQANNFFPADYQGKAAVTNRSSVNVAVELLKDSKLQDITNATIGWYLDNDLLDQGKGLKEVDFTATKTRGNFHSLHVIIKTDSDTTEATAALPVSDQKVVINNPSPTKTVASGSKVSLQAIPFFFNVKSLGNLTFSWKVNESEAVTGNDNELTLDVGTPKSDYDRNILIRATVRNTKVPTEVGTDGLTLTIAQ